jgi:hypothetical protein
MRKGIEVLNLLFLFFIIIEFSAAQNLEEMEVFAPFVSRLKAQAKDPVIVLTWKDCVDVISDVYIYRHTEEITDKTFNNAQQIAVVPYGTEVYTDYPLDTKTYFYAVLVKSGSDQIHKLFIPFRNKTIVGVNVVEIGPPEELATVITNINAENIDSTIFVTFNSSKPERELIMYRNNSPILSYTDLINAVSWVLDEGTTSYTDSPPAGIDYYYAIIDTEIVKIGKIELVSGENTTSVPVTIPLSGNEIVTEESPTTRSRPLPFLILQSGIESGEKLSTKFLNLPAKKDLEPGTIKAISNILSMTTLIPEEEPVITLLAEDKGDNQVGEEYILINTVKEYLLNGLYEESITQFKNFLSIHRTKEMEIKAHFYLAQAYYFTGEYREAILEFLLTREAYYMQVNHWLDACLNKIIDNSD